MTPKNCLNCGKELTDKYCAGCGQKADTHRISFKHFIFHDVMHGVFHIEKGILFTAKQALTRPGKAALDYIAGKRQRFYNVFYLVLLTIGTLLFVRHGFDWLFGNAEEVIEDQIDLNEATKKLDAIFAQKSKLLLLLFLPFAAFNSFILFRKQKLNLSEHFIIAGMVLLGVLLVSVFGHLLFYINLLVKIDNETLSMLIALAIVIYIGFAYVNAFKDRYSRLGITSRILLFFFLFCIELFFLMIILIGIATDWKYTEVNVAPFGR